MKTTRKAKRRHSTPHPTKKQRKGEAGQGASDDGLLLFEIAHARRLIRLAIEDIAGGRLRAAAAILEGADKSIARSLDGHTEAARRDVKAAVRHALGPDVTVGELSGARQALALMLDCLADFEPSAPMNL